MATRHKKSGFPASLDYYLYAYLLLSMAFVGSHTVAYASDYQQTHLSVPLFQSDILTLSKSPSRVSVGNPDIADIVLLRGGQVHVVGKALGATNVVFWDQSDIIYQSVTVEVTHDLGSLKRKLYTMMPDEPIRVYSAQEKLILKGQVSSATNVHAAVKVAEGYLPHCTEEPSEASGCGNAEVINLMKVVGSQQIMLEVKVAEISRTFLRTLDTDLTLLDIGPNQRFGAVNGGASWPNTTVQNELVPFTQAGIATGSQPVIGPMVDTFDPNTPLISDKGLFFQDLAGDTFFQAALELSRSKGLAKVLAEPTLTTLTGRPATFMSGGEFPVPVPEDGSTSIQFKNYGVLVEFLPSILDQDRISLDLDIAVSEITQTQSVDVGSVGTSGVFFIPSLTKRGVTSTVELKNGQTIGIAGLIQDNVNEVITKLPGLGDIPILGQLFRSQQFASGQTELVIFVTAHLAKPIEEKNIKLPTDSFVPPSDLEFYLLGRMEARPKKQSATDQSAATTTRGQTDSLTTHGLTGGIDGLAFGHDL